MTILAIIKGYGREALAECAKREIAANFIRQDCFGSTHVEIEDRFAVQVGKWFIEQRDIAPGRGYPTGTLLFFTQSKTEV